MRFGFIPLFALLLKILIYNTLINEYLRAAKKLCHIDKAILFGSYARGRHHKHSDLDIAIFSRDVNDKNRLKIMSQLFMLVYKFEQDIQPFVFSYQDYLRKDNDFIENEIKKKGIEIG